MIFFSESYIQTGPGSVFSKSSRTFSVSGYHLPYAWNETISYDPSKPSMSYLSQNLRASGAGASYKYNKFHLEACRMKWHNCYLNCSYATLIFWLPF